MDTNTNTDTSTIESRLKTLYKNNKKIFKRISKLKEKLFLNIKEKNLAEKEKLILSEKIGRKNEGKTEEKINMENYQEIDIELRCNEKSEKVYFFHEEEIVENQEGEVQKDNIKLYINNVKFPFKNHHFFYEETNKIKILISEK